MALKPLISVSLMNLWKNDDTIDQERLAKRYDTYECDVQYRTQPDGCQSYTRSGLKCKHLALRSNHPYCSYHRRNPRLKLEDIPKPFMPDRSTATGHCHGFTGRGPCKNLVFKGEKYCYPHHWFGELCDGADMGWKTMLGTLRIAQQCEATTTKGKRCGNFEYHLKDGCCHLHKS
jgi:hypothetical protein